MNVFSEMYSVHSFILLVLFDLIFPLFISYYPFESLDSNYRLLEVFCNGDTILNSSSAFDLSTCVVAFGLILINLSLCIRAWFIYTPLIWYQNCSGFIFLQWLWWAHWLWFDQECDFAEYFIKFELLVFVSSFLMFGLDGVLNLRKKRTFILLFYFSDCIYGIAI